MARCPNCGNEAGGEAKYCPHCGAELRVDMEVLKLKLEELRHDEKVGWLLFGIGVALMMFGLWLDLGFTTTTIEWRGLIPYEVTYHPYASVGLIIIAVGAFVEILGAAIAAYSSRKRSRLIRS